MCVRVCSACVPVGILYLVWAYSHTHTHMNTKRRKPKKDVFPVARAILPIGPTGQNFEFGVVGLTFSRIRGSACQISEIQPCWGVRRHDRLKDLQDARGCVKGNVKETV